MIKLGLTGSIGMGKSTIAAMFADEGVPVWDADLAVHRLYAESKAVQDKLTDVFGDVITDGIVDRHKLSAALKGEATRFESLNAIVHPALAEDRLAFFAAHKDAPLVVLDIPLLYETGAEADLDRVIVVACSPATQRERLRLQRGLANGLIERMIGAQLDLATKIARADHVVWNDSTPAALDDQARLFAAWLCQRYG